MRLNPIVVATVLLGSVKGFTPPAKALSKQSSPENYLNFRSQDFIENSHDVSPNSEINSDTKTINLSRTTNAFSLFMQNRQQSQGAHTDLSHSNLADKSQKTEICRVQELCISLLLEKCKKGEVVDSYAKGTIPKQLIENALIVFLILIKLDEVEKENVTVAPQSSTVLVKNSLKLLSDKNKGKDNVAIYPEGNFRYNFQVEEETGVAIVTTDVDKSSFKIDPKKLDEDITNLKKQGKNPIAFVLETPNNPGMQVYSDAELKEIAEVTKKHDLTVINDLYLFGTENVGMEQTPFANIAGPTQDVVTVWGPRRIFGFDKTGKVGYAHSNNPEIIKGLDSKSRSIHIQHFDLDVKIHTAFIGEIGTEKFDDARNKQKANLQKGRKHAESEIDKSDSFENITETQVGPFVITGIQKELEEKMTKAGLKDGYGVAEFFMLNTNVILMPLCDMSTDKIGFRINVSDSEQFDKGFLQMKELMQEVQSMTSEDLKEKVSADMNKVQEIYDSVLPSKTKENNHEISTALPQ